MRNERIVVSRQTLLDEVWGYHPFAETNTVDVFISNLRRKLESGGEPRLLHTVRGAGYVLRARREGARLPRSRLKVRRRSPAALTFAILLPVRHRDRRRRRASASAASFDDELRATAADLQDALSIAAASRRQRLDSRREPAAAPRAGGAVIRIVTLNGVVG